MFFPSSFSFYRPYVETHYRFKFGFTLLSRRAPEILFDLPFRVEPGLAIPALLLIKDADRFPLEILNLTVTLSTGRGRPLTHALPVKQGQISELFYHQMFTLPRPEGFSGDCYVNFKLEARIGEKKIMVWNDNLPFKNHLAYKVRLAGEPLPTLPGFWHGEPHFHSLHTHDQVEYGAPLAAVPQLAKSAGLSWAFVTDHSYDLDERNPLNAGKNRFEEVRREAAAASADNFLLIPGEEVSVRNEKGKNVHLCAVNHPHFLPGFGDSGQSLFRNRSELSVAEAVEKIETASEGLAFAAHAGARTGILEGPLLNRGNWESGDFAAPLHLMQVWNAGLDKGFFRARRRWITLLLAGRKMTALGGNDAHGDFNRSRRIGFPFLFINEDERIRFGFVRTAVESPALSPTGVLDGLRQGRAIMTNGPFVSLEAWEGGKRYGLGESLSGRAAEVRMSALSTPEFGPLKQLTLYRGTRGGEEQKVFSAPPASGSPFKFDARCALPSGKEGYVRAELGSGSGTQSFFALTNPIYLSP